MALARAIIGDSSDNLPGVKGAGFKTVAKRLGFLGESTTHTIDKVIDHCAEKSITSTLKFYENVVEQKGTIEHNYKMMQLYAPQMSVQSKTHVKESIENFQCEFNKTEVLRLMREDGFGELNWEELKAHLNKISIECLDTTTE
jgi:5'-3' exonuclease